MLFLPGFTSTGTLSSRIIQKGGATSPLFFSLLLITSSSSNLFLNCKTLIVTITVFVILPKSIFRSWPSYNRVYVRLYLSHVRMLLVLRTLLFNYIFFLWTLLSVPVILARSKRNPLQTFTVYKRNVWCSYIMITEAYGSLGWVTFIEVFQAFNFFFSKPLTIHVSILVGGKKTLFEKKKTEKNYSKLGCDTIRQDVL